MESHTIEPDREWMSKEAVCRTLGITMPTLRGLIADGTLVGYRIGARLKFTPADVQAYLQHARDEAQADAAASHAGDRPATDTPSGDDEPQSTTGADEALDHPAAPLGPISDQTTKQ